MSPRILASLLLCATLTGGASLGLAQLVVLPAPRLLTVFPMGVQAGTSIEVTIVGENIDEDPKLVFSTPKLSAEAKRDEKGEVVKNRFVVQAAADVPLGLHEARLLTRLGISSARCFSVGSLQEVARTKPNTSAETALELAVGSVCNAFTTARAIDFYTFKAARGARLLLDCTTTGIDSRLTSVLVLSDEQGREMLAERRTGFIDFTAPADGKYTLKVHGLTYQGGAENFYRLAVSEVAPGKPVARQPVTPAVSAASMPKIDPAATPFVDEVEPNNKAAQAQKIQLPCAIRGAFATAGDVDTYEFEGKKGDVWWVEAVSARLGLPTDPFVLVQRVTKGPSGEVLTDVAEFNDIPSPVKLSSGGYAYDGVPYDVGSPDALGKLECKEDGIYRLQIRDLFGGTRSDAGNVYQLVVRQAAPDFSVVNWAMHMELRNGDRANLSKPVALRGGATMAFDVVALRRDGFDGEINIEVENLPPGVKAAGLRIPPGKSQGTLLLTAAEDAPRGVSVAKVFGRAQINGAEVRRNCPSASMAWPVKDHSAEVPAPRLFADMPVSVGGAELTPLSILPGQEQPFEAVAGQKLTVPLKLQWRGEFSAGPVKLKPLGADFAGVAAFDVASKAAQSEVVLDLAALKLTPGDYTLALHGGVVSKYSYNPGAVKVVEAEQQEIDKKAALAATELQKLTAAAKEAPPEKAAETQALTKAAGEKMKAMEAAKADVVKRMKSVSDVAAPKEIVDIVVSEPIRVRVKTAEAK
jgi:hypothetical protein